MITDFYIDCELYTRSKLIDPSGGEYWGYTKTSDIKGIMVPSLKKQLIDGVWSSVEESVFVTNDLITDDQTVKYKGHMYQRKSELNDVMEIGHHYEIKMELINNV